MVAVNIGIAASVQSEKYEHKCRIKTKNPRTQAAVVQAFPSTHSYRNRGGKWQCELSKRCRYVKKRKQGRKEQKTTAETKTPELPTESLLSWQMLFTPTTNALFFFVCARCGQRMANSPTGHMAPVWSLTLALKALAH